MVNLFKIIHKNIQNHETTVQEKEILKHLIEMAILSPDEVIARLGSNPEGLSTAEVEKQRAVFGRNVILHEKHHPWYKQLLQAFNNPFNYVLLLLAVVSLITGDSKGMIIIVVMVLISVFIKFTQEYKSAKSARMLRAMVHTTCNVYRQDGQGVSLHAEIPMEDLVPGDIIHLAAGDIIPADIRILSCKDLYISQSALTGEAMPVEKNDHPEKALQDAAAVNALELSDICFMGTNVDIGSAKAIVINTGSHSYFGAMASRLSEKRQPTGFDIGINKVSWLLIRFMLVMAPAVFLISGFTKGNWIEAFLFALSVAVGLTPEMLPMVVTTNLAKGAVRMSKEKVIVKRLNSIQNFGAMNILCTDKTGTLTEDRIVLIKHLDIYGNESRLVLEYAFLNSYYQSGLKNLMDVAILNNKDLNNEEELENKWKKIDEIPFDFVRRRMSVILQHTGGHQVLICKGAVEEMIRCARYVNTPGGEVEINAGLKEIINTNTNALNQEGLRVVAVGHRCFQKMPADPFTLADEADIVLDGYIAFLDPPKESVKEALVSLKENGIQVKVLTGDNDIVTRKVCQEVGLTDDRILSGSAIESLTDDQLQPLIHDYSIFAKLAPMQKARIIALLRKNGDIVGYMGDGINDAPALREADIGISVDSGVDIAKENADIILLQKNLLVLNKGVVEGRKTFANIMKYIKITASSNFGNVFSLIGASALFPFLPMLPIQILILNLIYDISQTSIPWDNVDRDYLSKPRKWIASDIKRFMLYIGPASSVFDYATFAVMYFIFKANSPDNQALFQTGWFVESLFTQTLIVQLLRTEKIPFLQSRASAVVLLTSGLLLTIGLILPYTGVGRSIGFAVLPLSYYGWLALILAGYFAVAQLMKNLYIRKFKSWL